MLVAEDCAANRTPGQLLKGDGLHKNDRPGDLFGVTAEALLGREDSGAILVFGVPNLDSLPSGKPGIDGTRPGAQQRHGNAQAGQQQAERRVMTR